MSNLKRITLKDFMYAFYYLKEHHENSNEPLPEINDTRNLESVLEYPFQSFYGKVLYWGFYKKAACYFWSIAKGHIFINGNKRCGVMAVNLFYELNNRTLSVSDDDMYTLAKYIANSKSDDKEYVITRVSNILKNNSC